MLLDTCSIDREVCRKDSAYSAIWSRPATCGVLALGEEEKPVAKALDAQLTSSEAGSLVSGYRRCNVKAGAWWGNEPLG